MPIPKAIHLAGPDSDYKKAIKDTSEAFQPVNQAEARRLDFVGSAILNGFSKEQAEWLFENLAPKGPLL